MIPAMFARLGAGAARGGSAARAASGSGASVSNMTKLENLLSSLQMAKSMQKKRHDSLEGDAKKESEKTLQNMEAKIKQLTSKIAELKSSNKSAESVDYTRGLKRGGEGSDKNKFVSKAAFERYKSMYGEEAAQKRFYGDQVSAAPAEEVKAPGFFARQKERVKEKYADFQERREERRANQPDSIPRQGSRVNWFKPVAVVAGAGFGLGAWLFKSSDYDKERVSDVGASFLLAAAILIHFFDFRLTGFEIDPASITSRFIAYLFISILAFFVLKMNAADSMREFLFVSLLPLLIFPLFTGWLTDFGFMSEVVSDFNAFLFLLPVWPIYLVFFKGLNQGFVATLTRIYIFFLIVLALFMVIVNISVVVAQISPTGGVDSDQAIVDGMDLIRNGINSVREGVEGVFGGFRTTVDRQINETLGRGYQAQVEDARDQAGVFLDNLRPIGVFFENQSIRLYADFSVNSFIENVQVEFFCSIRDRNGREIFGVTNPSNITVGSVMDTRRIFCDFDSEEYNVSFGRFDARLDARFNFGTSGYTTYYFVPVETLQESGRQSWNQRYRIPTRPINIYTAGPVFLGLNESVTLPIPVYADRSSFFALDFGIRNDQQRGEIRQITAFEARVPQALMLRPDQCTIPLQLVGTDNAEVPYSIYRYELPEGNQNRVLAVSCNVEILPDRVDTISSSAVRPVTIFANVSYVYQLTSRASINVERLRNI